MKEQTIKTKLQKYNDKIYLNVTGPESKEFQIITTRTDVGFVVDIYIQKNEEPYIIESIPIWDEDLTNE